MSDYWSFVWTPQFLLGTVVAGILLNIVGTYAVRALDHIGKALPASHQRLRAEEAMRIEQLTAAATSDHALYAALAAEASRLRLLQLLRFFIALVLSYTVLFLVAFGEVKPGISLLNFLFIAALLVVAFLQYCRGLDFGRHARRLDIALRAVQRNRKLPVMD